MKADWKPGTLLAPVPVVMVSMADAAGKTNILTVAWPTLRRRRQGFRFREISGFRRYE